MIVFILISFFVTICSPADLVQADMTYASPSDTIYYLGGRAMPANIASVTTHKVFYTNLDETTIFEIDRKQVEKIVYRTGRVDVLNRPVFQMISEDDWRHIFLTEDSGDIEGLYERGPVEVTAAASRNRKATIRNAEIRLKRQASILRANIVLVTNTEFRGGYGDIPSIRMKGIAYGFEPLPVED